MKNSGVFSFLFMVACIIFYQVSPCFGFNPSLKYLIDCGSQTNTRVGGRVFVADSSAAKFLLTLQDIFVETFSNSSVDFPPYETARIFLENSSYTLPITRPGRYWIRLYFLPFTHRNYNMSLANFSVSTGKLLLLNNFTPLPGGSKKEFSIDAARSLEITFTPSYNSFAYINALEVVSVPDSLIPNNAATVTPEGGKFRGLLRQALETMERVNMGGPLVNFDDDNLWRTWVPDRSFLTVPKSAKAMSKIEAVTYPRDGMTQDTAPIIVYGTATAMHTEISPSATFNLTWEFNVDPGFQYLIRLHFCDIVSPFPHQYHFNVYIDSWNVLPNFYLEFQDNGLLAVAKHVDFVTSMANKSKLRVSVSPSAELRYRNAFLNGLEIMKMISARSSSNADRLGLFVGVAVLAVLVVATGVVLFLCGRRKVIERLGHSISSTEGTNSHEMARMGYANISYHRTFAVVKEATNNFAESRVIGSGGFGKVYRGTLRDGTKVAVKRGNPKSQQGVGEFRNEIEMLSQLHHPHLVSLIGYCDERHEQILIYEYMENDTLQSRLCGSSGSLPSLGWKERLEICIGSAKGLHYLHENAVIHRDVKSSNILLDKNNSAKVTDFGLSKMVTASDQTHVSTVVKGTFGYLDPEYSFTLQLREKSDVYSFGVVLFEVLCARPVIDQSLPRERINLTKWALECLRKGLIETIIDPNLVGEINPSSLGKYVDTAARCVEEIGIHRPSMAEVIWNLEYALQLQQDAVLENNNPEQNRANNTVGEPSSRGKEIVELPP